MATFDININSQNVTENSQVGEAVSKGDLVYLADDTKYYRADASFKAQSTTELKIALTDGIINQEIPLLAFGFFEYDTPSLIPGSKYYVSTTTGGITTSLYVGTNNVVRYIGTAHSDTILLFNPDQTYISDNGFRVNDVPLQTTLQPHTHLESDISDLDKYSQSQIDNLLIQKENLNTGLIQFGDLVVPSPGVSTTFNINFGLGVVNRWDGSIINTAQIYIVPFGPFTNITPLYLASAPATYIGISYDENTQTPSIEQRSSPFTDEERRDIIILGVIIHSNNTVINLANNIAAPIHSSVNQLHDLMEAIGPLNVDGNTISPNGANLSINKSAGDIFKLGVGLFGNYKDPHKLDLPQQSPVTFRYRLGDSTEFANRTTIDPTIWDDGTSTPAVVPNNQYTIQRIYMFQSGAIRIQPGQTIYATKIDAVAALLTENRAIEQNIRENGLLRASLVVKKETVNLQNLPNAEFFDAGKFGNAGIGGGGGVTLAQIIAAIGYTPENIANKTNTIGAGSTTLYPTTQAVINYTAGLGDKNYVHTQGIADTTWTINHNLNKRPSITVIDNSGIINEGQIAYPSANQATVSFNVAISGTAYVN